MSSPARTPPRNRTHSDIIPRIAMTPEYLANFLKLFLAGTFVAGLVFGALGPVLMAGVAAFEVPAAVATVMEFGGPLLGGLLAALVYGRAKPRT